MSAAHGPAALDTLKQLPSDELLAFLSRQRWFAIKGASPEGARVADAVIMPWGDERFAIARIVVDAGGTEHVYQLPCRLGDAPNLDAVSDADFRAGLVDALAIGGQAESDGVRWIAEPIVREPVREPTRLGGAEQSNTSIIAGDRAIVKLFRTLQTGIHPDVEVTRFLTTRAGFANTPRLLGVARFEDAAGATTAAMMQEFLPGSTDAWSFALDQSREYFTAPREREPPNRFVADALRLGAVTRAMHEALAGDEDDPAFAPEDVAPEDLDRWAHRTQQTIRDAVALLERQAAQPSFPAARIAEAQALIRRRDHYLGWVNEIDDTLGDDVGVRIRTHGDYHLGQVLRASGGEFMIIDFEGEPSKSLAERREKTSPLRDVAGMLRSFGYAAAMLAMDAGKQLDVGTRELRAARWERDVRAAFLEGYLAPAEDDGPELLPEDAAHTRQLITLFETEKAFYELAYELNNRPAWSWIPMRGIAKLFLG